MMNLKNQLQIKSTSHAREVTTKRSDSLATMVILQKNSPLTFYKDSIRNKILLTKFKELCNHLTR